MGLAQRRLMYLQTNMNKKLLVRIKKKFGCSIESVHKNKYFLQIYTFLTTN